ncbi:MAG: type IV secretion system protein VirD4 [Brevundimonas sp.]|jgi:type IV secretion system protein VirD4|uniref:type IV secretory system conjugative DNA transfer family protein n=1 Tax=Brevundimonas sp. TaxID=1871086 RepID=UPI0039E48D08
MASRLAALAVALVAGGQAAAQAFAWVYRFDPVLGAAMRPGPDIAIYPPWALLDWRARFPEAEPGMAAAAPAFLLGFGLTLAAGLALTARPATRRRGWGGMAEARAAGLRDPGGCIIGEMNGRLLATGDLRPTLVTGGTRSGKGRGHVLPTLLSWPESTLVHDPKGELWAVSAGWRSGFSHVLRFAPRDPASARFNPLAEIRPGPQELAEVQRLVAILADPGGVRDDEAIWDKAASEILEAVILHVLYTAPDDEKTLLTVRRLIADLDETAEMMNRTLHREGPDGTPETHPFIATAVKGYAAMHDRFRTSVQGTARSYLKWLAGEDLEHALSASDLALGDLMCARAPVSLYVQVAPADAAALRPLVRLFFYAAAQALTAEEKSDAAGRPKAWQLLMMMDEFPLLGRLAFFEKSLRLMSGYGIKTMFVAQSLNDIVETYGAHNTILDNCHVYTAFSALDPLTQDKVSRLTGSVLEPRESRSRPAGLSGGNASVSRSEIERPLLEPGEIRALPDDTQLVFAAGHRPLRTRKMKYDRRRPFARRARIAPPAPGAPVDTPGRPPHPWEGRRALGEDPAAALPLFKEVEAAIHERRVAARAAETYERVSTEFAAQQAALDSLQGERHEP